MTALSLPRWFTIFSRTRATEKRNHKVYEIHDAPAIERFIESLTGSRLNAVPVAIGTGHCQTHYVNVSGISRTWDDRWVIEGGVQRVEYSDGTSVRGSAYRSHRHVVFVATVRYTERGAFGQFETWVE